MHTQTSTTVWTTATHASSLLLHLRLSLSLRRCLLFPPTPLFGPLGSHHHRHVTHQFNQRLYKKPQILQFSIRLGISSFEKQSILIFRALTGNGAEEWAIEDEENSLKMIYSTNWSSSRKLQQQLKPSLET